MVNFAVFLEKVIKSILTVAQCVCVRYRLSGLAIFLNKGAVLIHIGYSYVAFFEKASKSILNDAQCLSGRHCRNGLGMFLNKMAEFRMGTTHSVGLMQERHAAIDTNRNELSDNKGKTSYCHSTG